MSDNSLPKKSALSRRGFISVGITGAVLGSLSACRDSVPEVRLPIRKPTAPDDEAWREIRSHFSTNPGVVYFNNASLGMPPTIVAKTVAQGYDALSRDPIGAKHELGDLVRQEVVPNLALFAGADADEVVLTRNATEALHLAAMSLNLQAGDNVVITSQEHPAGRQPWMVRQARDGVHVTEVFVPSPFDREDETIDRIASAISARTRAIAFCHVTRGGHLYPVKRLSQFARDRGLISIVDGAQAIGMLPVNLHDLDCDVYAASLHKWLLGPMGTGMLYIRRSARDRMTSTYAETGSSLQPGFDPPGTPDLPLKTGVGAAISFVNDIGITAIAARDRYLSDYLKSQLTTLQRVQIVSGPTASTSAPGSTIFEMDGVDALESVPALAKADGLHIDEHKRDNHNAIRISTHFYNTTLEIDRLIRELDRL